MAARGIARVAALALLYILCCADGVVARTREEWAKRSIYQVLTDRFATTTATNISAPECNTNDMKYCGGTWKGIQDNLDYIQGMGFDAIWISPVVKNTPDGYHGYWAKDLYSVNEQFGSAEDLKALVQACHARDIWVMVDVVANHFGPQANGNDDFSQFTPFNKPEHYHPYCVISQQDWDSMNQYDIEHCRLADLPDLDQEQEFVRGALLKWVGWLVRSFAFDALRIDTVPEVSAGFWKEFVGAAGVFAVGEVFNGDPHYVYGYSEAVGAVLDYPLFFALRDAFMGKQGLDGLAARAGELAGLSAQHATTGVLAGFLDNHDNPRFLCHTADQAQDWTLLKNALAFLLLYQQIPIVYYGTEQGFAGCGDPGNRESLFGHRDPAALLYSFIKQVHAARRLAEEHASFFGTPPLFLDTDQPAKAVGLARGSLLLLASNRGSDHADSPLSLALPPALQGAGTVVDLLGAAGEEFRVSPEGRLHLFIRNGQPRLLVPPHWRTHPAPDPVLH